MRTGIVAGSLAALIALGLIIGNNVDNGPNPFIMLGIMNGAVFGLVALGLVLVYKGTRVFNFTQGEFGTIAAYVLFFSIDKFDLPYGVGIVLALALTLVLGLAVERIFIRPLINAPRVNVLVVTIAIALLLIGLEILFFRVEPLSLKSLISPLDSAGNANGIELFGLDIEPQRLLALGVLGGLGVGLAYFFSRTDLGLAVLATSQDAFATRVVGIGIERMSRFIWGAAAILGAIAGILYIPLTGALTPAVMTTNILIPAFTGAVLGGMTSLPGAFVGGVVVSVVQTTALWAGGSEYFEVGGVALSEKIPGIEHISILIVLLLVLLIRPAGLLGKET
jgi:branched-chain amino acid transport system permease protein